jgi:nicotinate dehydrogenase subunit A
MTKIKFTLNGTAVTCSFASNTKLLWVLREELGDTSARFGCGEALCGSCMVTMDGRAMHSCDVPLWAAEDKTVCTAAGLPDTDTGRALLEAFDELQAGQCGYCLPGVLMTAHSLLEQEGAPDRMRIGQALDRNLCRCGAHVRILAAIELAALRLAARQVVQQ